MNWFLTPVLALSSGDAAEPSGLNLQCHMICYEKSMPSEDDSTGGGRVPAIDDLANGRSKFITRSLPEIAADCIARTGVTVCVLKLPNNLCREDLKACEARYHHDSRDKQY